MSQYDAEIDLRASTSHAQVAALVGGDRQVLDVGCWKGELGVALQRRGCTVSGVDISAEAAEVARTLLAEVEVANLDTTPLSTIYPDRRFDVVVFADVLEHLHDPVAVLADAATVLAPGGRVVMSLPNVTHGSVRLALLQGNWRYTETGLLDRTHVRFFSRAEVVSMMRSAGFIIDELRATMADPLAVEVLVEPDALPPTIVEWVRGQRDSMVYQFVVSGRPSPDAAEAPVPELVPGDDPFAVRSRDRFTAQVDEVEQLRHRLLTLRDHVLGLEATATAGREQAQRAEAKVQTARERLRRKNETVTILRRRMRRAEARIEALTAEAARAPDSSGSRVRRAVRSSLGR